MVLVSSQNTIGRTVVAFHMLLATVVPGTDCTKVGGSSKLLAVKVMGMLLPLVLFNAHNQ